MATEKKYSQIDIPFNGSFEFNRNFYESETFKNINKSYSNSVYYDIEFYNCSFEECKFNECSFKACTFEGCSFSTCDLSVIKIIDSSFHNVVLTGSKVVGINWSETTSIDVSFLNCVLNGSTFFGLNLTNLKMVDCIAKDVNFTEANLCKGDFTGTDFFGSRFLNTNLSFANFAQSKNYNINPQINKFKKTKFSLPDAISLLSNLDIILE
jgi:uncharacterized protein YjbI with pentapeptide repeats